MEDGMSKRTIRVGDKLFNRVHCVEVEVLEVYKSGAVRVRVPEWEPHGLMMPKVEDLVASREVFLALVDAERELHAATEAAAKARDAVVEAARAFRAADWSDRDQEECDVDNAVVRLVDAERAEAEARAKLEALRG